MSDEDPHQTEKKARREGRARSRSHSGSNSDSDGRRRNSSDQEKKKKKKLAEVLLRRKKLKNVFIRFSERTTLQGFGFINNSKTLFAKTFWIVIVTAALIAMVIHVKRLFDDYYTWPKKTSVSLGFDTVPLPAITICNINILKLSMVKKIPHGDKMVKFLERISFAAEETKNAWEQLRSTAGPTVIGLPTNNGFDDFLPDHEIIPGPMDDTDPLLKPKEEGKFAEINAMFKQFYAESNRYLDHGYVTEQLFKSLYVDIPRSERQDAGHQIGDMLINCTYGGETCSAKNFSLYQSPDHGNCWTFTSNVSVRDSGPQAGLRLVLFMENYEFINRLTLGYGARIVIHPQGSLPIPKEEGFHVSSGFETDVSLRKVEISRLPRPYGDCTPIYPFKKNFGIFYTRPSCLKFCRVARHIDACGCYPVDDEDIFRLLKNASLRQCSNETERLCSLRHREKILQTIGECKCSNPCEEVQYVRHMGQLDWPSDFYIAVLENHACALWNRTCQVFKKTDTHLRSKNFLKLNVYYEDLNYNHIYEEPEYTLPGFMSDLGGATGLWIGLSLMSVFEILQFLADLVDFFLNRAMLISEKEVKKKREKKASVQNNGGELNRGSPNLFARFGKLPLFNRGKHARVNSTPTHGPAELEHFDVSKDGETFLP